MESAEWRGSLARVVDTQRNMLNSQHSAHLRRIGKQTTFSRVETYDLSDEAAKSSGGRAQIDHASETITPGMDGGDTSEELLGWRRELTLNEHEITHGDWRMLLSPFLAGLQRSQIVRRPSSPEVLSQLTDQKPALSWWNLALASLVASSSGTKKG